jgi:hypothetical protein
MREPKKTYTPTIGNKRGSGGGSQVTFTRMLMQTDANKIYTSTLYGNIWGLKAFTGPTDSTYEVPSLLPKDSYVPNVERPTGLGTALLWDATGGFDTRVWVSNNLRTGEGTIESPYVYYFDYKGIIPVSTVFTTRKSIKIPVAGTSPVEYATVYLPWSL